LHYIHVAAAALLIILSIVLVLVDRKTWRSSALFAHVACIALAVIFGITAFIAIAEWRALLDSQDESGLDINVGYSWILMLIAGVLACCCIVGSAMGFLATKKINSVVDHPNTSVIVK
jgi:apolipoprotein N-acyltransferase